MRSLFKLPTCFESCQEINNGRIAMFAIMGQIVAELQTGKGSGGAVHGLRSTEE